MDRGTWLATVHGVTKNWADWVTKHSTAHEHNPIMIITQYSKYTRLKLVNKNLNFFPLTAGLEVPVI